ncbi:hypothetical protein, partial [Salmonella sp. s51090]|uniref:hypothetical protein n=1 Tax=Salmonella sp. s51090 TaxID=3159651 RepID=UPI0039814B77
MGKVDPNVPLHLHQFTYNYKFRKVIVDNFGSMLDRSFVEPRFTAIDRSIQPHPLNILANHSRDYTTKIPLQNVNNPPPLLHSVIVQCVVR